MKRNIVILIVVLLLAITASVSAQESTSPLCTLEEFEQQKALNLELYKTCKANDGAFLCLHNDGEISTECRALNRVDEPDISYEKAGTYPVQNIEIDGIRTKWFYDWFSFYKDPLTLCTKEDYESQKETFISQYEYVVERDGAFLCRYDTADNKIISHAVILTQNQSYPATMKCEELYPVRYFDHQNGGETPWVCETYTRTITPTIQK